MKYLLLIALFLPSFLQAELAQTEAEAVAFFEKAGARIGKNEEGHVVSLQFGGDSISAEEMQQIGLFSHLERLAINQPQAGNDDWGFLSKLSNLKNLTIWHARKIHSLAPFSNLQIESLTVGGSMGLRDLNKENPEDYRDAVLTLHDLPKLLSVNLYHSPNLSRDDHIEHLAKEFPGLEEVKIDVAGIRNFPTEITPAGLKALQDLPIRTLSIENATTFGPEHMAALAGIESLEALLLDYRRKTFDASPLVAEMKKLRPEVEVVVAEEGASGPPRRARKK